MSVPIRQMLVSPDKYGIKCTYPMNPEFIVVHNTANDASANNEIAYMNRNNSYTSYHFAVDDKEIVQGLPLDRNGWHAGDGAYGNGNRNGIGIEICYSIGGGTRFDQAELNTAWLVAKLLKERGWGLDKVKKHQDFMNKYCPHRTLDYGWERFLNMVRKELAPQVEWHSWDYPPLISKIPTVLFELPSKRQIKTLPVGTVISDFVEYTHVDGIAYLRTKYSKDNNKNYGFVETDFEKYVEKKPKNESNSSIQYELIPKKTVELIKDSNLWDFNFSDWSSAKSLKVFSQGTKLNVVAIATNSLGAKYYVTEYSFNKGLTNGVNITDCKDYVAQLEPIEEKPNLQSDDTEKIPEGINPQPLPAPLPMPLPKDDSPQSSQEGPEKDPPADTPLTPNEEKQKDELQNSAGGVLRAIISLISKIFKFLFERKK